MVTNFGLSTLYSNSGVLGIGGFQVRRPWARREFNEEGLESSQPPGASAFPLSQSEEAEIKKKRLQKRKQKNKISENYPSYIQEAFFGKDLLGPSLSASREGGHTSDSDQETGQSPFLASTITLSQVRFPFSFLFSFICSLINGICCLKFCCIEELYSRTNTL